MAKKGKTVGGGVGSYRERIGRKLEDRGSKKVGKKRAAKKRAAKR